jgi:glycosyltransferase involved in cell wall biosynthesis
MAPDLALVVTTFQRPHNLERSLISIAAQCGVDGRFEVMVADDGSTDDTFDLVRSMARQVSFPLGFTTHTHDQFHVARCRNDGARATSAPYILFIDGDCVLPPDHLQIHLAARRENTVVGSDCARLGEVESTKITGADIRRWNGDGWAPPEERRRLRLKAARAKFYEILRVPMRPRLTGNNIALWRTDFERVNGFDERFIGWGFEDTDLQSRLERAGLSVHSILSRSTPVHLWHPPDPTSARNGIGTANRLLYLSSDRPVVSRAGLRIPDGTQDAAFVWSLDRERNRALTTAAP